MLPHTSKKFQNLSVLNVLLMFNRRNSYFSACYILHIFKNGDESHVVELVRNLMAHAQKPGFVFRLNGRVHLNRRGSQFSRLVAAEVCVSALVMLDTPSSEVVWEYWLLTPFASFPFTSPPVRHRVPSHSERSITLIRVSAPGCHPCNTARYNTIRNTRSIWTRSPLIK